MKKLLSVLILFLMFIIPAGAQEMFMTITGTASGTIQGEVKRKGHENQIEVSSFELLVTAPRETGGGMATGKRVKGPFTITKPFDISSISLYKSQMNGEILKAVTLDVFFPSAMGDGTSFLGVRYELTDAVVSSFKQESVAGKVVEEIKFSYKGIKITHVSKGASVSDQGVVQ